MQEHVSTHTMDLPGKVALAGWAMLCVALLAIVGRILSYPLNRDENMFVSVASQVGNGDLYRDLGYNHLPNLAYLLSGAFALTGTEYYLLTGRLVVFGGWLVAIIAIWMIVRRLELGVEAFFVGSALLVGNVLLLGPSGMLATNNFLPLPFVLFAFFSLLGALDPKKPRMVDAFLAGSLVSIAIGLKANYIILAPAFVAATLVAPASRSLRDRLVMAFVPLAVGGVVGGLPALIHLALDPEGFLAHTLRYFTELQTAYWAHEDTEKVVGVRGKVYLAELVWLRGATLIGLFASLLLGFILLFQSGWRGLMDWRVGMLLGLLALSVFISFVPTPSFSQYFLPPIPFLVLLVLVLAKRVHDVGNPALMPVLAAIALVAFLSGGSRLTSGLLEFRNASEWETLSLKRRVKEAGSALGLEPGGLVATLSPVHAIEGGYSIYPEFAAGQFVYRVAPYIQPDDKAFYRTTSPEGLDAFLKQNPPSAILVNMAEPMEEDLAAFARAQGFEAYEEHSLANGFDLYVAPDPSK